MGFFTWQGKLLTKGGKFATDVRCCCGKFYCVLTRAGKYECRNQRPDPATGDQVLSEHDKDADCKKVCYERYYCYKAPGGVSTCKKERELPNGTDDPYIIGGPYPKSECEASCTTCPPCADEHCKTDRTGDAQGYNDCCAKYGESWEYKDDGAGGEAWELVSECAEGGQCVGSGDPPFPNNPQVGDTHTFDCAPSGKDPPSDNKDCQECLYDCNPIDPMDPDSEKRCESTSGGEYTKDECDEKCLGLWHCTDKHNCERQQKPDPESVGYDTETECLDAAEENCAEVVWQCETPDRCVSNTRPGPGPTYDNEIDCVGNAPIDCAPDSSWVCFEDNGKYECRFIVGDGSGYDTEEECKKQCVPKVTCYLCFERIDKECREHHEKVTPDTCVNDLKGYTKLDDCNAVCQPVRGACCVEFQGKDGQRWKSCYSDLDEAGCINREFDVTPIQAEAIQRVTFVEKVGCNDIDCDTVVWPCYTCNPYWGSGGGYWTPGGSGGGGCYLGDFEPREQCLKNNWLGSDQYGLTHVTLADCEECLKNAGVCCVEDVGGQKYATPGQAAVCDWLAQQPEIRSATFLGAGTHVDGSVCP